MPSRDSRRCPADLIRDRNIAFGFFVATPVASVSTLLGLEVMKIALRDNAIARRKLVGFNIG